MAWRLERSAPPHLAPKTFRACSALHAHASDPRLRASWNLDSRDMDAFGDPLKAPVPLEAILLTHMMGEFGGDRGPVPTFEEFFVAPMRRHLATLCEISRVVTAFAINPP